MFEICTLFNRSKASKRASTTSTSATSTQSATQEKTLAKLPSMNMSASINIKKRDSLPKTPPLSVNLLFTIQKRWTPAYPLGSLWSKLCPVTASPPAGRLRTRGSVTMSCSRSGSQVKTLWFSSFLGCKWKRWVVVGGPCKRGGINFLPKEGFPGGLGVKRPFMTL